MLDERVSAFDIAKVRSFIRYLIMKSPFRAPTAYTRSKKYGDTLHARLSHIRLRAATYTYIYKTAQKAHRVYM